MEDKNKMSLFAAILMNINVMVGTGIFLIPALMAQKALNLSFLGWPVIGLVFLPVVLSVSQIAKFFPGEGSFYTYSKKGLNQTAGFASGWLYFLGYASVAALQVITLRTILINQINLNFINGHEILFNFLFVGFIVLLNCLSIALISKVQSSVTFFKLLPIFFVILIFAFYWNPNLNLKLSDLGLVRYTIPFAIFGFWGFESSCNISHLIKGHKNNASRAVLIGFFTVVFLYTLFHFGLIHIMGSQNLANYGVAAFAEYLRIPSAIFANLINAIISSIIIIAFISSNFGVILSNSSNLHIMAQDNLFPFSNKLKKVNKNERPIFCIAITGIVTFIFATLINKPEILTPICNFGPLSAFILTFISLLLIQKQRRCYSQIIITILGIISCYSIIHYSWLIIGDTNLIRLTYLFPLLILTLLGFVAYKFNKA